MLVNNSNPASKVNAKFHLEVVFWAWYIVKIEVGLNWCSPKFNTPMDDIHYDIRICKTVVLVQGDRDFGTYHSDVHSILNIEPLLRSTVHPHSCITKKIAFYHGFKQGTALGFALCCLRVLPTLLMLFLCIALCSALPSST